LFELFVAVSLFASYFFLVRNFFPYGDPMNFNVFTAGSEKLYRLDQSFIARDWNGRISGLLLTGALTDFSLDENSTGKAQFDRLTNVFGLYHACWLLLLFVCIIFALRYSLFINLGIFAGLMYDFSPTSGPYFYPWDMPAMLLFTLAVLFFERRLVWITVALVCVGCFFKETILICALLVFFADHWKWRKRILTFIGIVLFYTLGKKLLLSQLHIAAPMYSVADALHFRGSLSPGTLIHNFIENVQVLFSASFNSVLFVNAGTLLAVLVLGWQKRFLPYMTIIVAFMAALFFVNPPPGIGEIRVFIEVLPISLFLLSVLWMEYYKVSPAGGFAENTSAWPVRETFPFLFPIVIAVVALFTSIVTIQYYIILEDIQPANQAQSQLGKYVYTSGKTTSLEVARQIFQNGYADTELKLAIIAQAEHRDADAIAQYQRVLDMDTNSLYALNNLATLLATDSDARLRDGNRAVQLAERARQLSQNNEPALLYTLAAAYAEAGRFNDAVATAQKARILALAQGQREMAKDYDPLIELYKSGHAFHVQP
jgi:hypothetical protein